MVLPVEMIQKSKEEQQIEELYKSLDIDGDGKLELREIKKGLQGVKNNEYIYQLLKNADTDGSLEIDFEEFCQALRGFDVFGDKVMDARQLKMINQIWAKYDIDHSGELEFREIKRYVKDSIGIIPDEVFLHIFNNFDQDNSGAIGKSEMLDFIDMLTKEADHDREEIKEGPSCCKNKDVQRAEDNHAYY